MSPTLSVAHRACVDFKSKKIRVNINQPIKAEQKNEKDDVMKHVDEDRKYVIQATIVRSAAVALIVCSPF